ncbi:erythromycin esterase family protein [Deinococcus sp. SDU3-2]|uniref:Erythromycin esterase family protein n=1 Tax=Deinococcus terrestris TaxID=2651870 RepID=A0A7X1NXY8_9DEIO|nr:erythromycin esterase family protein [Deinococcus terrestris]MPY67564.1 erythromycin esterase family protein [Deinococcus terrestris]
MPHHSPLQIGWDMTEPHSALSCFLDTLPAAPRLLALGEPTHGLDAFPAWRNRIFRTLAEDHGFRSIAIESDVIAGLRVNAHVTAGQGRLDEVMQTGFSHGFGAVKANRDLVQWMRDFNAGRAPEDHLRFYGFDAPLENLWAASPRASLLALHAFLTTQLGDLPVDSATIDDLCGEDARWTNPAAGMDAAQSTGQSGEARQLRLLADDLFSLLRTETPGLAAHPGFWEAQLHARTATGLLRYHAVVADPAPTRVARMLALRDLMMADNLSAVAEREGERGPTLVFAHNAHLQRHVSAVTLPSLGMRVEWWSAGAHVSIRLGQQYAFVASDLGSAPAKGIGEPAPDTLEGALMTLAGPVSLVTSGTLTASLPDHLAPRTGVPPQAGYFPLGAQHLPLTNGVLFVKTATD